MGHGIDRVARSRRPKGGVRALFGKAPPAAEVGERLVRLAKRMLRGAIVDATAKRLTLRLHPAAPPVRVVVRPDGDLEVRGETSGVGPGYHADIVTRLAPILDELEFAWVGGDEDVMATHAAWLADQLRDGDGPHRIGMPSERTFLIDAPVVTAMGPRDAAWRAAVLADPRRGADAFAWWETGPGERERSRALLAMWHEVPWRAPIDEDERAIMERVDADLRAAHAAAPGLALPWPEWSQILDHLAIDDALARQVRARGGLATIGYRRHDMEVELSGGWSVRLPGAFVGTWQDDEERYVATDGVRSIEFTSLVASSSEHDSAGLLAVAPERHAVIARLADDDRCGRAEGYDEDGVRVVHGLMTQAPNVAILTCKGDEPWAVATWRSLVCDGSR